jgi:hypothetical protein
MASTLKAMPGFFADLSLKVTGITDLNPEPIFHVGGNSIVPSQAEASLPPVVLRIPPPPVMIDLRRWWCNQACSSCCRGNLSSCDYAVQCEATLINFACDCLPSCYWCNRACGYCRGGDNSACGFACSRACNECFCKECVT